MSRLAEQPRPRQPTARGWWFGWRATVIGLLAAAALAVAWRRLDVSDCPEVTRFRDDAYYYFAWARSLAAGAGPCVTAGVPTNGVHPLWGLLLALAAWLLGPGAVPAFAQAAGLVLHAQAALLVAWVLRRDRFAATAAALVYWGNPVLWTEAQNGQETALACCAAALLVAAVRAPERGFALAAVLATLARSDLLLLVVALALFRHRRSPRAVLAPVLAGAALAGTDLLLAGHWLQDSALPIPWLFAHNTGARSGLAAWAEVWWWLRPCLLGGAWSTVSPLLAALLVWQAAAGRAAARLRWLALPAVGLVWLGGAENLLVPLLAAGLLALWPRGAGARRPYLALVLGWTAIMVLHYVLRHYPRPYYFAPLGAASALALGGLMARPVAGAALALVAAGWQLADTARPVPVRAWQQEYAMAGQLLSQLIPGREPVGCFNAGIATWYEPARVLNLDGVVNRPAFEALRRHDLDGYLDRHGVRLLLDNAIEFERARPGERQSHASGAYFGPGFDRRGSLRELLRFDVPGADAGRPGTDSFRLYWRVGRGEPPVLPERPADLGPAPCGYRRVLWPARPGQRLVCIDPSGAERELLVADAEVAVVVAVPAPRPGRYILHAGDRASPLLSFEVH